VRVGRCGGAAAEAVIGMVTHQAEDRFTVEGVAKDARKQWRQVADQLRLCVSKPAALMDQAEADVLAYTAFPAQHRA